MASESFWWCHRCLTRVDPEHVTFHEYHDGCGGSCEVLDDEPDVFAAARAWQAFRDWCGPFRACVWTQSEYNLWETDCNGAFEVNDGGPYDNDMRFCCYCGGALIERPYEDAEDDGDD